MRALRFKYLWLFGGFCLVGLLLYSTLTPPGPAPAMMNDKVAHALAFLILMVWFCGVYELRKAPFVAFALLLLGIAIEFFQGQTGYRSAELADGLADLAGIALGWVMAATGLQYWAIRIESWLVPK